MKHALLITAFKDLDQLATIAGCVDDRFKIFVHIDRKTTLSEAQMHRLQAIPRIVCCEQFYRVNWGGRNHLRAILHLCEEALKHPDIGYLHCITAQDLPIKSPEHIITHFTRLEGRSYLEYFSIPAEGWEEGGGLDRLRYFSFYDGFNFKTQRNRIVRLIQWQKRLGIRRSYARSLPKLYAGSTYWSLHRDAVAHVLAYTRAKPQLLKRLKHTFCAEEFYFQTVLVNSPFAASLIPENRRLILWTPKHNSVPAILDEEDWDVIEKSDAFFARKFDIRISDPLAKRCRAHFAGASVGSG